ncbi:hypothetical protein MNBD_GAMMA23-2424 [hydrothermal vent metagenome]|uniref:Uncharacterized protein n=1 Tax=hydrothermal vent metagenome TaxID=652676 RepID=A0A3B0ZLQ4_9ZZZZ
MKKLAHGLLFLSALLLASPAFAGGHLRVINDTNTRIDIECGHDGKAGRAHGVSHGRSQGIDIHGRGEIHCSAFNDHGRKVASRSFHYDHGNESYRWRVNNAGHHNQGGGH